MHALLPCYPWFQAALVAFNPGLDCTALKAGQLVCTGTQGAPTATCGFRCAASPNREKLLIQGYYAYGRTKGSGLR